MFIFIFIFIYTNSLSGYLTVFDRYHNGNDQELGQLRGFGHIGFLVDDLSAACAWLEERGVAFKKKPADGNMRDIAFVYDPDNYW